MVSWLFQKGVIVAGGEEYLIEPLVSAKNFTNEDGREGRPHVVYKRSSLRYQNMDQSCGVIGKNDKNHEDVFYTSTTP